MISKSQRTKTISWFGTTAELTGPNLSTQYALIDSETIDGQSSTLEPVTGIVDVLIDVIESAAGQTTLTLYEYVNPDPLEDITEASASKKSDIEVRFTVDDYLIVVRSNNTVLIYEPIGAQRETSGNPCLAS